MSPTRAPIVCVGEAVIDFIVTDGAGSLETANAFDARNGGAPANVAVSLARLGLPSAFVGAVGDDPFGTRLIDGLAATGVSTEYVVRRSVPTTIAFTWKDERGDGHFRILRQADVTLEYADIESTLSNAAALVAGSVALAADPSRTAIVTAAQHAVASGVPVCFDVNLRPSLWPSMETASAVCAEVQRAATVLKLSLDDANGLFPGVVDPQAVFDRLDAIHRVPIVVLTDGARGCWYRTDTDRVAHQPAFSVPAVEPTGAGDAFFGALICRLLINDWRPPAAADIQYAAAAGALATLRPGAWDGQPTAIALDEFVTQVTSVPA